MKTKEQIDKIRAVVLYILNQFPDGVDYVKLFKIMYFAQRRYLSTYGMCIVDDTFKARQKGPVPALTYKVMKIAETGEGIGESQDLTDFSNSVKIDKNQRVHATCEPDMDYIAEMELHVLDEEIAEKRNIPSDVLSRMSHDSAYKKVCKRMKDDPQKDSLTCIDIARAGGASEEVLESIREMQQIERVLAS
ncbi:MAG: SocA family protein [Prevotella sp.]|nr:SocA family protein [Prevotella sp.]